MSRSRRQVCPPSPGLVEVDAVLGAIQTPPATPLFRAQDPSSVAPVEDSGLRRSNAVRTRRATGLEQPTQQYPATPYPARAPTQVMNNQGINIARRSNSGKFYNDPIHVRREQAAAPRPSFYPLHTPHPSDTPVRSPYARCNTEQVSPNPVRPTRGNSVAAPSISSTELSRTNTTASTISRRQSLKTAFGNIKRRVSIVAQGPKARRQSIASAKRAHDEEVEAHRRANPMDRPQYQRDFLVQCKGAVDRSRQNAELSATAVSAAKEARMQERAMRRKLANKGINVDTNTNRTAAADEACLHSATCEAMFYPRHRRESLSPTSTLSGKAMDENDRDEALDWATHNPLVPSPVEPDAFVLPKADAVAVKIGERLDKLVGRSRSNSDDDIVGFRDTPPKGSMEWL